MTARFQTSTDGDELDPQWEWVELRRLHASSPRYIKGSCRHVEVVDVDLVLTGEVVARLCTTCFEQLPASWRSLSQAPRIAELAAEADLG